MWPQREVAVLVKGLLSTLPSKPLSSSPVLVIPSLVALGSSCGLGLGGHLTLYSWPSAYNCPFNNVQRYNSLGKNYFQPVLALIPANTIPAIM